MEIIRYIAETINLLLEKTVFSMNTFLQVNYTVISSILNCVFFIAKHLTDSIIQVSTAVKFCYVDFVLFLDDVKTLVSIVKSSVSSFLFKSFGQISHVQSVFMYYIWIIWTNIIEMICFVYDISHAIYMNVVYMISLLLASILLILQAGPNCLIFLIETVIYSVFYLFYLSKCVIFTLVKDIANICTDAFLAVYSIPVKAYLGALLFILIYYQYKPVIYFSKVYLSMLLALMKQVGMSIYECLCFCSKTIMSFGEYIFISLKRVICSLLMFKTAPIHSNEPLSGKSRISTLSKYLTNAKSALKKSPLLNRKHIEEQIQSLEKQLNAEREKSLCVICFDRPKGIILYPCSHLCVCQECSRILLIEQQVCPLCRCDIENTYHVYI